MEEVQVGEEEEKYEGLGRLSEELLVSFGSLAATWVMQGGKRKSSSS